MSEMAGNNGGLIVSLGRCTGALILNHVMCLYETEQLEDQYQQFLNDDSKKQLTRLWKFPWVLWI